MNKLLIKILIGLVCKTLISKRKVNVNAHNCDLITFNEAWGFNCTNKGLKEIPQDMDPDIEVLVLQGNKFISLNENSFARYKNLISLSLLSTEYINTTVPIDYYTFRSLKKLEILIVRNITPYFNSSLYWPPNLMHLAVSGNLYIKDIDLSMVTNIRNLFASSCGLTSFPKFNKLAPLTGVDLRWNPLENLSAEDLAPFCLLRIVVLEWVGIGPLSNPKKYCQCLRLQSWMQLFRIDYRLTSNVPLFCIPPLYEIDFKCDLEFSDQLLQQRQECLERYQLPLFSKWFLIISAIIVLSPFVILACWYSERRQKLLLQKAKKEEVEEQEED